MEEAEARRRQDEEARKQKALQQVCAGARLIVLHTVEMAAVCCGLCKQGMQQERWNEPTEWKLGWRDCPQSSTLRFFQRYAVSC